MNHLKQTEKTSRVDLIKADLQAGRRHYMQVHETHSHIHTHICTLAFNRSPEPKESQHHPSG